MHTESVSTSWRHYAHRKRFHVMTPLCIQKAFLCHDVIMHTESVSILWRHVACSKCFHVMTSYCIQKAFSCHDVIMHWNPSLQIVQVGPLKFMATIHIIGLIYCRWVSWMGTAPCIGESVRGSGIFMTHIFALVTSYGVRDLGQRWIHWIMTRNDIRWMAQKLCDDKSTLVQVMAWCRQATSHYLNRCRERPMAPYDVMRLIYNILILGVWCSTIPHLPGCFCPWTFFENIGFNTVPTDPFMSHLATQLGYSAGEFQALQLIVLATFGVVD